MRRLIPLLCSAAVLALAPAALAEEPPETVSASDELERLPSQLDSFVQDAIEEGLLRPARPAGEARKDDTEGAAPSSQAPAAKSASASGDPSKADGDAEQAFADYVCGDDSPYDFTVFRDVRTYGDLTTWTGLVDEEPTPGARLVMAKAWLALGLATEARGELRGQTIQSARALRELADLFDPRSRPDLTLFEEIATCHTDAAIWSGVAKLKANLPDGAGQFEASLDQFRALPLRLRAEIALVTVPALDRLQRHDLLAETMASFTPDEIAASSNLRFAEAIQGLAVGDIAAQEYVRRAHRSGRYGSVAGAALRRHGYSVAAVFETELAQSYLAGIGTLSEDAPVEQTFGVVLDDLNDAVDYAMTLTLADMPAAGNSAARSRLAEHYETMVDADLESASFLDNLKAMDALLRGSSLLALREGTDTRLARAAATAANLGLKSMSEKLSGHVKNNDALAIAQAELAYQMGDHEGLWALVRAHPGIPAVTKIAAIDAIGRGDRQAFSRLSGRVPLDEETALMLIEADAAAGHWIVPDLYYSLAEGSEDETVQARAERARSARPAATSADSSQIALVDVSARLARLRQSLNADPTEIR